MHKPTICAIRGAICVAKDEPLYIEAAACRLYKAILEQNNLDEIYSALLPLMWQEFFHGMNFPALQ